MNPLNFTYTFRLDSLDHQRGRIITHSGQNSSNLVKQEHCVDVVGMFIHETV